MTGLIKTKREFISTSSHVLVNQLKSLYPFAEQGQITSWNVLIEDVKNAPQFSLLSDDVIVGVEYSLPTEGMAIDLLIAGRDNEGKKQVFIIESKQWNDSLIRAYSFSAYREVGKELHPQVQVSKHKLSFSKYVNIGPDFSVYPFVFIRNCSFPITQYLVEQCPRNNCKSIPVANSIDSIFSRVNQVIITGDDSIAEELANAEYEPSIEIINAMKSIMSKEEPFILTQEQLQAVSTIKNGISNGNRIIRIVGAAGTGKTAILLNLYVEYLNQENSDIRPIFISGAQNTALYRSLYSEVEGSFNYSFSLGRMVAKTKGNLYVILMDEAQHNSPGIITEMIDRGCTLIMCYDKNQTINAENAIEELKQIEQREDFVAIQLYDRIRFSGSQNAEQNIQSYLSGNTTFLPDDKFDFELCTTFAEFQNRIVDTIRSHPDNTVAVAGLLSQDSTEFTVGNNADSILFTKWGSKSECEWIPYVRDKNYFAKNDGNLWVGTWWLPGLDVDYIAVIVGGDAKMTANGIVAVPEQAKHYRMMVSISQKMGLPGNLILEKKVFGKIATDYFRSSKKIIEFINQRGHEGIKEQYINEFSELLRNNYYITMSRGRKGCFVFFANNECQ